MKINIKNPFYFQRGSMSLTDRQVKALRANKKLVAVDKNSGATHPVNNQIALKTLTQRTDPETGLFTYYTAWFK
jgi:hypothetical protein